VQQLGAFFNAVGGVLWLDQEAIKALQSEPNGLSVALWILLLATVSDVIGNRSLETGTTAPPLPGAPGATPVPLP